MAALLFKLGVDASIEQDIDRHLNRLERIGIACDEQKEITDAAKKLAGELRPKEKRYAVDDSEFKGGDTTKKSAVVAFTEDLEKGKFSLDDNSVGYQYAPGGLPVAWRSKYGGQPLPVKCALPKGEWKATKFKFRRPWTIGDAGVSLDDWLHGRNGLFKAIDEKFNPGHLPRSRKYMPGTHNARFFDAETGDDQTFYKLFKDKDWTAVKNDAKRVIVEKMNKTKSFVILTPNYSPVGTPFDLLVWFPVAFDKTTKMVTEADSALLQEIDAQKTDLKLSTPIPAALAAPTGAPAAAAPPAPPPPAGGPPPEVDAAFANVNVPGILLRKSGAYTSDFPLYKAECEKNQEISSYWTAKGNTYFLQKASKSPETGKIAFAPNDAMMLLRPAFEEHLKNMANTCSTTPTGGSASVVQQAKQLLEKYR